MLEVYCYQRKWGLYSRQLIKLFVRNKDPDNLSFLGVTSYMLEILYETKPLKEILK
jgi:hypothetical protein